MSRSSGARVSMADGDEMQEPIETEGFHLIQFWVPDVRSPAFLEEAERQSLAVAQSPYEADDQAFIAAISTWDNE